MSKYGKTRYLLSILLIATLLGCQNAAQRSHKLVEILIENPENEPAFQELSTMALNGTELERMASMDALREFYKVHPDKIRKMLPLVYGNLFHEDKFVSHSAIVNLSIYSNSNTTESIPFILEVMKKNNGADIRGSCLHAIENIGCTACSCVDELGQYFTNKDSSEILSIIFY